MKKVANETRFLLITSAIVALVGFQTVNDLVRPEPVPVVRVPASIAASVSAPAVPRLPSWKEPLLEWNCAKDVAPFTVQGRYLRLRGKGCGEKFKAENLRIVNESNGFTASVFAKGTERYETDLIQLQNGVNRIRVQYLSLPGQKKDLVFDVTASSI